MRNPDALFNPVANSRERLGLSLVETQTLFVACSVVLFVVLVANQTHIETVDAVKLAPRLELMARLGGTALAGLIGIYGFLCMPRVQKAMFTFPGAWVTGIAVCYVAGTAFSDHKSEAVPHLITFACIFLFTPTAFHVMGTRRFIEVTLLALLTSLVASWFLYLFMPEYGMRLEVTDGATGEGVMRMSGASHPNTLAGLSGLTLMIVVYLFLEKRMSFRWAVPFVVLCLATYVFTQTRVAAVSAVLAIAFAYRGAMLKSKVLPMTVTLAVLAVAGFTYVALAGTGGVGAESLTRSGNVEEITSFTGRNEIWAFVAEKIGESPVVGYGPGVAKTLLARKEMLLHPHNVVLSLAVTGGVICGLFGLMMFLHQLWIALGSKARLVVMLTIFIFLNSLTEAFIFDYIPGTSTMLWLFALYYPILDDDSL